METLTNNHKFECRKTTHFCSYMCVEPHFSRSAKQESEHYLHSGRNCGALKKRKEKKAANFVLATQMEELYWNKASMWVLTAPWKSNIKSPFSWVCEDIPEITGRASDHRGVTSGGGGGGRGEQVTKSLTTSMQARAANLDPILILYIRVFTCFSKSNLRLLKTCF